VPAGFIRYRLPRANTAALVSTESEPTSFTQAVKCEKWRAAMENEFNALIDNRTWTLVPPKSSMNIIRSKWVFKIKRKADGSVERYKARLVAKGFHQQPSVDFSETYSLVIKPITIRTVLSMVVSAGRCIKQIDISNAFLHGHLQEMVHMSQPHISFAVSKVSQFMHEPRDVHWISVKRILQYLKSAIDSGLIIKECSSLQIFAYSDVDWARCPDNKKSTSGYCIFLGTNLISWSSKKQPTISHSSTEAEYKAIANATAEILWIQSLFRDIGVFMHAAPLILCNNIGATYLSSNSAFHAHTKHIDIDYHFVRDLVAEKLLVVKFLSNKDQIANILTKPLVSKRFCLLCSNLNVCSPILRLQGCIEARDDKDQQQGLKSA
jgi:hypothetical protein